MTRLARAFQFPVLTLVASLLVAASAAAQDTTATAQDSLPPGNPPQDTVVAIADTVLAVARPAVPRGPLPPGTRFTFTRDSLHWLAGHTLADLLATIPGVFVARAGFLGQPEFVQYGGRGGTAVELYWDGMLMMPLGADSLAHDLGRVSLSYLERVDVEVLPTTLRVYLVSERHGSLATKSKLRVVAGDFETGAYAGLFQKRWRGGMGLDLAADFLGTEVTGQTAQTFDVWGGVSWLPSSRTGASYQVRRQNHDRATVTGVLGRDGTKSDYLFSMFASAREDGLGLRAEGLLASSSWSSDSGETDVPDQVVRQAQLKLQYRMPTWTAEVIGRTGDSRVRSALEGRVGWVPLNGVVVSGDGYWRRHPGDRYSRGAHGSLGLYVGPLSLVGQLQYADLVAAPALADDSARSTLDRSVRAGLRTLPLSGHVALVRRDAFVPLPYAELLDVAAFDSSAGSTYVVADVSLRSSRALSFDVSYSDAIGDESADLQPPTHGRAQITFQSKFWRTFRSGVFDFRVQLGMESWSGGTAGMTAEGTPIELPPATLYDIFVQVQLVDFTLFWHYRDARRPVGPYLPGIFYPGFHQTFGVKWAFLN